jgi:hypothetical protein
MVFTPINLTAFAVTLLASLALVLVQNLAELASASKAHI